MEVDRILGDEAFEEGGSDIDARQARDQVGWVDPGLCPIPRNSTVGRNIVTWFHSAAAVVDDDAAVLDSLKILLEASGYTVGAYSSAEAFLHDPAARPACLILDQHMPRMTGLELTAHLRTRGVEIPILLMSGQLSPAIVAGAAQLGIQLVLEKPPSEADLLSFVDAYN